MPERNRPDTGPVMNRDLVQSYFYSSAPATYSFLVEKILRTVPLAHAFVSKQITYE